MSFNLVDKILELSKAKSIVAIKNISLAEDFIDNYPNPPCMSDMLVIECVAQAAAWLVTVSTSFKKRPVLLSFGNINFYRSVFAGEQVVLEAEVESWMDEAVALKGRAKVNGQIIADVDYALCALIDAEQLEDPDKTKRCFSFLKNF